MKNRPFLLLASSTALIFCSFSLNSKADTATFQNADQHPKTSALPEIETVTPTNKVTPHEAQVMSSDAATVMRHISDARQYIGRKKYDLAKNELNQAQAIVDMIRSEMPTLRIKDRINLAQNHLKYQDTENVTADLVPIYSDLSFAEDFSPAKKVKGHLDKAKMALNSGDKVTAKNELKAADESVAYTEIDFPLNETQKNVKSALFALNQNQPKMADKDLAKVENNLQISFSDLIATPVNQKTGAAANG